ncbi:MAG: substrate-binding domain-containing protein [Oscillospiraceae bacterium]|nr:substrate-binding domain-containing protein [Oscillospiraceae bacterium]
MAFKYQQIAAELRARIEAGTYDGALPTEFAISEAFQASRQTVRRALALLVDDGLIERRQGSGSRLLPRQTPAKSRRTTVAVITTYINDYIFPGILREMEHVFAAGNCMPLLFSTHNQVDMERRLLRQLLDLSVDGVLIEGSKTVLPNPNQDLYQKLRDRGLPVVFLHGIYPDLPWALSVLDDNRGGGRMLVEYLYRKGHRNIAGMFKSDDIQGLQRYEGYMTQLRDLELPMDDRRVFWYDTSLKELLTAGEFWDRAEKVLEGCTAVVCYNDEIATQLVNALRKKGVDIPGELAVVSFDNSPLSDLCPVPVTSLSHGENNLGRMAAELMLRCLRGETCRSEKAGWVLVEKASS